MTTTTNAENLRQYKIRFSLITKHGKRSKKPVSKFQTNCLTMFYVIEYFHLDG